MLKTNGILNKMRVWLDFGPAYNYYLLYYEENNKEEKISKKKYDVTMPNNIMKIYGFIHTVLLMITTLMFIQLSSKNFNSFIILLGFYNLFGFFSISCLFDQKKYAKLLETFRLILTFFFILFITKPLSPSLLENSYSYISYWAKERIIQFTLFLVFFFIVILHLSYVKKNKIK